MTLVNAAAVSHDGWLDTITGMPTMSLEGANSVAALLTRRDRKYLVSLDLLVDAVQSLTSTSDLTVLQVGGEVVQRYRSVYFDNDQFDLYRLAATGRRRRYKVRRREYVDNGLCALEVKTKDSRGRTVKERSGVAAVGPGAHDFPLSADEEAFVAESLCTAGIDRAISPATLRPSVETGYLRTTIVAAAEGWRATVDRDLVGAAAGGTMVAMGSKVVVETKSSGMPTPLDHLLWARGARPVRVSKFAVAMAITQPGLAANRWNRVLRDDFDWKPLSV